MLVRMMKEKSSVMFSRRCKKTFVVFQFIGMFSREDDGEDTIPHGHITSLVRSMKKGISSHGESFV